jgi:hypothetical protein
MISELANVDIQDYLFKFRILTGRLSSNYSRHPCRFSHLAYFIDGTDIQWKFVKLQIFEWDGFKTTNSMQNSFTGGSVLFMSLDMEPYKLYHSFVPKLIYGRVMRSNTFKCLILLS